MAVTVNHSLIWTKMALSYRFTNSVSGDGDLTQEQAESEFQAACDKWAKVTGLTFSKSSTDDADIVVTWAPIDGVGEVLANCEYPKGSNSAISMKIDTGDNWTKSSVPLTTHSFQAVVLHELGHGVGMMHTANPEAVMYPIATSHFFPKVELAVDDIEGAKFLYKGAKGDIEIVNETDTYVSWFAFNSNDAAKWLALASGSLSPNEIKHYSPVKNGTGKYFIRFTDNGGGRALAGGVVATPANVSLYSVGSNGYHIEIS